MREIKYTIGCFVCVCVFFFKGMKKISTIFLLYFHENDSPFHTHTIYIYIYQYQPNFAYTNAQHKTHIATPEIIIKDLRFFAELSASDSVSRCFRLISLIRCSMTVWRSARFRRRSSALFDLHTKKGDY